MWDDIPEDRDPTYACPRCDNGNVTQMPKSKKWVCDSCGWTPKEDIKDDMD